MEKNKVKIDGIDKEIIRMLIENARRPILEIAKKIGISGAAIHQRLRKLEKSELINGSSISIDQKILGYNTMAYIGIFLDTLGCGYFVGEEDRKALHEALKGH